MLTFWLCVVVALILGAAYVWAIKKLDLDKGVQAVSTIATTLATLGLAVFAWNQMQDAAQQRAFERTAKWGELPNAMWEIVDSVPQPGGIPELMQKPISEQQAWFAATRRILDSQIGNPVLIENRDCLAHWRNAISTARTAPAILAATGEKERALVEKQATGLFRDVMFVWERIVLDSDEPAATGGRLSK